MIDDDTGNPLIVILLHRTKSTGNLDVIQGSNRLRVLKVIVYKEFKSKPQNVIHLNWLPKNSKGRATVLYLVYLAEGWSCKGSGMKTHNSSVRPPCHCVSNILLDLFFTVANLLNFPIGILSFFALPYKTQPPHEMMLDKFTMFLCTFRLLTPLCLLVNAAILDFTSSPHFNCIHLF